jgi:entry exclusion lipoprotein TrbK
MARRPVQALAAVLTTLLCACSPRSQEQTDPGQMPEVTVANCTTEAIKRLPKQVQQPFASACFRAGGYTPSPERRW